MLGYHQTYYRIDVGSASLESARIPPAVLETYIGGVGLGTWLLQHESPPGLDALATESAIVIAFSPLVGTPLTTSAKFALVAKSPLTGRLNDSLSSSQFAIAGKRTGADALVIRGQAAQWSTIVLDDGEFSLRPSADLVGLSAAQTEERLRDELGKDFAILAIGMAGERGVHYATVSHDGRHAGRGGLGAVFGSKRIKAIAVRGNRRTPLADQAKVVQLARDLSARSLGPATEKYRELGTVANLLTFNRLSVLPTRNFQQTSFEGAEAISGEALATMAGKVRRSCAACTIGCEHIFPIAAGGSVRLEYESLFALGSLCGIADRDGILQAARLCDDYGIDTISFGGTFAFACELVERGMMPAPADLDLRFGNGEALLQAIELVGRNEGTGRRLAQGSRRLALEVGQGAIDFAPQVKGLEIPGYDPRAAQMMGLGFAVGSRGADHNRSSAYEADFSSESNRLAADARDVHLAIATEDRAALLDSMIFCKFLRGVFEDIFAESAAMLTAITGEQRTADDLRRSARQIVLLKRLYNEREGWSRNEDTLPKRFLEEPLADGVGAGTVLSSERLESLVSAYYAARGLSSEGRLPDDFRILPTLQGVGR